MLRAFCPLLSLLTAKKTDVSEYITSTRLCILYYSYEVQGCEVIWAIKDSSITHTFIDSGAAAFFLPHLASEKDEGAGPIKRHKYQLDGTYCPWMTAHL